MRISNQGLEYAWGVRSVSHSIKISSKGMNFRAKLVVCSVSHSVEIYVLANSFGFRPGVRSEKHPIGIEPIS